MGIVTDFTGHSMLRALAATLVLAVSACAAPVNYEASKQPGVNIAAFESFRLDRHATVDDMQPARQQAQKVIERILTEELLAKGYRPVESGEDFVVDYVMYSESQYQQGGHDRYMLDERLRIVSGTEAQLANPVRIGTLHIHFLYPGDGGPFFEAIGQGVVDEQGVEEDAVRRAIRRMLAAIPARNSGDSRERRPD